MNKFSCSNRYIVIPFLLFVLILLYTNRTKISTKSFDFFAPVNPTGTGYDKSISVQYRCLSPLHGQAAKGIQHVAPVFKALSLGAPYVKLVAIGRGAMAAAMSGKKVGELIENGAVPEMYKSFGHAEDSVFLEAKALSRVYKDVKGHISTGSIGLYSFIQRVNWGMKLLMTLNRKFKLELIDQSDVIPLTKEAKEYLYKEYPEMDLPDGS